MDSREHADWHEGGAWLQPGAVDVDPDALHWAKISPETADQSLDALGRMRPHLPSASTLFADDAARRGARDRLAGDDAFSEQDLRFFDLYFGGTRIRVDGAGGALRVVNGRHRLARATARGADVPVSYTAYPDTMSIFESGSDSRDAQDLDRELDEQEDLIGELEQQIQDAEMAVERAEAAAGRLDALRARGDSEHLERAEAAGEALRAELDRVQNEYQDAVQEADRQLDDTYDASLERDRALKQEQGALHQDLEETPDSLPDVRQNIEEQAEAVGDDMAENQDRMDRASKLRDRLNVIRR